MSFLGRLGSRIKQALERTGRRVEVAAGLLLTLFGLVCVREIGDILAGQQAVAGAPPPAPIALLAVAAALSIGFGVRFIHKGF